LRRKSENRRGAEKIKIRSRMKLNWVTVRKRSTANPTSHSHGESAVTMRPPSKNPMGMRLNRLRKKPV
jgi:hypothetical protein